MAGSGVGADARLRGPSPGGGPGRDGVAARAPGEELRHLPELEVHGLVNGEARALLGAAVGLRFDERVCDRIVAGAHGNPLALLELRRGLTVTELAGGFGLLGAQALTPPIEESFVARLQTLSHDARQLLLLPAADPVGDPLLLRHAAEQLGVTVSPLDTNIDTDGLLSVGTRVTFRHPLVRSAVYRSAAAEDRRTVHVALAEASDRVVDPDRRAWHLAATATGPDEQVASELERSAGPAQARGGLGATALFLKRAVELTLDPARRAEPALAAAAVSLEAGAFGAALGLLATVGTGALDEFQQARVDLLRGHVAFASGLGGDAPRLLLKAARRPERFDIDLARETYLTAWGAAVFAGPAGGGALDEIFRAVRALPPPSEAPRPLDLLLDGLALLVTDGRGAATPTLREAAEALAGIPVEDVVRWGWAATGASDALWDDERTSAISARNVQVVRDAGALAELPIHLAALGLAKAWTGDFEGAGSLIAESEGVAATTGSPIAPYTLLRLRALQGDEAEASAPIASARARASGSRRAGSSGGLGALGRGGPVQRSRPLRGGGFGGPPGHVGHLRAMGLDVGVARARGGGSTHRRRRAGPDALERLVETTRPSATDFALGIETRFAALLSGPAGADELYCEAIERLGRTRLRPELARARLLYGEWLRRDQRRVDAREQLRAAHDQFTSIGMEAFGERARRELVATGEKVRKRTVETRDELTAQERQTAQMARDGLSNAEIAARLFVSPRTVEWHLRKVFTKVGVRSRRERAGALRSSDSELLPV